MPFPYLATRLPNGNTLISSGDGYGSPRGFFVVEVNKDGKTVWKYGGADAPEDAATEVAQRPRPAGQRQHPDRRGPRRRHPRSVARKEDRPPHPQPRDETSRHHCRCGGVRGWSVEHSQSHQRRRSAWARQTSRPPHQDGLIEGGN